MSRAGAFNDWLALRITNGVGTMWCAYGFAGLSLVSLPGVLATRSVVAIVGWLAQTFLQLVLLSILMVGQRVLDAKHDATAQSVAELHGKHDALHAAHAEVARQVREVHGLHIHGTWPEDRHRDRP